MSTRRRSYSSRGSAVRRYASIVLPTIVVLSLAILPGVTQAARPGSAGNASAGGVEEAKFKRIIHINNYRFDPLVKTPDLPPGLRYEGVPADRPSYYILQFNDLVAPDMKRGVAAVGVALLHYIGHDAFVARGDVPSIQKASQLPAVRWLGLYQPAYKLSSHLDKNYDAVLQESLDHQFQGRPAVAAPRIDTSVRVPVHILTVEPSGIDEVGAAIRSIGGTEQSRYLSQFGVIRAEVPRGALEQLARIPAVMWIDRHYPAFPTNDVARWVIQSNDGTNFSAPIHAHGLYGTGQLVTMGDTGIDYDHDMFQDPDVPSPGSTHRKVVAYYVPDGAVGDLSDNYPDDHGTHTSGTVAGDAGIWHQYDGDSSGLNERPGPHDGQAFDASLQMQDITNDAFGVYPPLDMTNMFGPAVTSGSYVHSDSWGGCCAHYYDTSINIDTFIWNNKDFIAVFAAGNNGPYPWGVNYFGTPKNVLAVGATGNGALASGMADFSSRGPVRESGRLKPDITAPGVSIWSAEGCDQISNCTEDQYWALNGTSMATPAVAGLATLVRQYFLEGWYPSGSKQQGSGVVPSAALVKAILINSATEMTGPGSYDNGETRYPNNQQGWGRVLLDDGLYFRGDARQLLVDDNSVGVGRNDTFAYKVSTSASQPFEVTLVWTDYPGTPLANPDLVNDLDLVVSSPNNKTYRGNQYTGYNFGESLAGSNAQDRINNVESVLVRSNVPTGTWTIKVSGYNVPQGEPMTGRQRYALVITGAGIVAEAGRLQMDADRYRPTVTVGLELRDFQLNLNARAKDTATVLLSSATEPIAQTVTLTETGNTTAVFTGTVVLDNRSTPIAGDGKLQVVNGDYIAATYSDASDGHGGSGNVRVTALVDGVVPAITGVAVTAISPTRATVSWTTSEASDSVVTYGASKPPAINVSDRARVTSHRVALSGLTPATTFYFSVQSSDEAGNAAISSNGGTYHQFDTAAISGPEAEWPELQNTGSRQGRASSHFLPPLQRRWTTPALPGYEGDDGQVVIADGRLFVGTPDGVVRARDLTNGSLLWQRRPYGGKPVRSLLAASGRLYGVFCDYFCGVFALDASSGSPIWSVKQNLEYAGLAYGDGLLYTVQPEFTIVALRAADGTVAWNQSANYVSPDMVAIAGKLIVGSGGYLENRTNAYNTSNGALLWSAPVGGSVPVYADGKIFTAGGDGSIFALSVSTGAVVWQSIAMPGVSYSRPAFDGSTLYYGLSLGTNGYRAINASNGAVRWTTSVNSQTTAALAWANGSLYSLALNPNELQTINPSNGAIVGTNALGGAPSDHVAVWNGWIYATDTSGQVYAFQGTLVDGDGDGDPDDADCAPANPAVRHGVIEVCNGIDDNCVNGVDEGCGQPGCDGNGVCGAGESCATCPSDCPSGTAGGPACGNGICEAGNGEDCLTCAADCNGKQSGSNSGKYCCSDGSVTGAVSPVTCADSRCAANGKTCTSTPVQPTSFCCGNANCEAGESCGSCALDCTRGAEICTGGIDEDCNGLIDCADPACATSCGGPVCGDHVCQTGSAEDCLNCPTDCNGKQSGSNAGKYCCSDGTVPGAVNPVMCADSRCTANGNTCL